MPTRREFIEVLLAAALGSSCRQHRPSPAGGAEAGSAPAAPGAEAGVERPTPPAAAATPAGPTAAEDDPEAAAAAREAIRPPVRIEQQKALTGIRQVPGARDRLVEVRGQDPAAMLRAACDAIGGLEGFVRPGDRVVLTPNFAWARPQAAGITTDPELVREMVLMCQRIGARDIVLLDFTTDPTPRAYRVNGAYAAVQGTQARLLCPTSAEQYVRIGDFSRQPVHARRVEWQAVPAALLRCNALITMPVFKHHREVGVSGAVKKQMGSVWRRRAYHEAGLEDCLAELAALLRPTLAVVDATRCLASNGPEGPGKTIRPGRLVVSADPVLADAHACRFLSTPRRDVAYLAKAARLGAGNDNPDRAQIERLKA